MAHDAIVTSSERAATTQLLPGRYSTFPCSWMLHKTQCFGCKSLWGEATRTSRVSRAAIWLAGIISRTKNIDRIAAPFRVRLWKM